MAKILFINPVIRQEDAPRHIPYGVAQILSILKKNYKHKIQVLDANAWRPSDAQLLKVLRLDDWDIIAIGGLITSYGYIKKCVEYSRKICPKSLIVAGGGFISPIPFEVMGFLRQIDIGVIGEGVVTFPELAESYTRGEKDFSGVKGIIWRDKGRLVLNAQRPLLEDVDSLPFPAYEMFPMDIYFRNSSVLLSEEAMKAKRRISVLASYGCPFKCKYCFHLGLGGELRVVNETLEVDYKEPRVIRAHSPEYVTDLVSVCYKKYRIDFVSFNDENLVFMDRKTKGEWTSNFFGLWKKKGLSKIHWGTTAHPALVTPKLLIAMRKSGCTYLDYGFESFDDGILRSIGKGSTSVMNERALRWTMAAGIRPIPNQIIGFPDETFGSLKVTLKAWKRLGIRSNPFFATPYPGSEWYFQFKERILSQYGGDLESFLLDLGDATKITAVISKNFTAVELLGIRDLMVNMDLKRIVDYEKVYNSRTRDMA